MNQLTPAQQKVIETWTEQRDTLLREVGALQTEKGSLNKEVSEKGASLTEINLAIAEARGRLSELDALEDRRKSSVSIEVAELEARKSRLEAECLAAEAKVKASEVEETRIITSIGVLCDAHDKMADQAAIVNKVVGEMIETTQVHVSETKTIMADIRAISTEVIEKGNENIKQTGIILEKLPRYIFELQRPIPVRRYHEARTKNGINPDIVNEVKESNKESQK